MILFPVFALFRVRKFENILNAKSMDLVSQCLIVSSLVFPPNDIKLDVIICGIHIKKQEICSSIVTWRKETDRSCYFLNRMLWASSRLIGWYKSMLISLVMNRLNKRMLPVISCIWDHVYLASIHIKIRVNTQYDRSPFFNLMISLLEYWEKSYLELSLLNFFFQYLISYNC